MKMLAWTAIEADPDVVSSDLVDGGILFDLNSKRYFALSDTGLAAWRAVEAGASLADLQDRLTERHPERRGEDPFGLRAFAARLLEQGVARPRRGTASGTLPPLELPADWAPPTLEPHGSPLAEVVLSPFDPTVPIPE